MFSCFVGGVGELTVKRELISIETQNGYKEVGLATKRMHSKLNQEPINWLLAKCNYVHD